MKIIKTKFKGLFIVKQVENKDSRVTKTLNSMHFIQKSAQTVTRDKSVKVIRVVREL